MKYMIHCDEKYIKRGGRKAPKMDLGTFKAKFEAASNQNESTGYYKYINILEKASVSKDLEKINFDMENIMCEENPDSVYINENEIVGYHHIGGLSFYGFIAGGDWEMPVYLIVYYDGKKFRGYIPTAGNTYNTEQKTAFGSEDDSEDGTKYIAEQLNTEYDPCKDGLLYNWEWLVKDITSRIVVH